MEEDQSDSASCILDVDVPDAVEFGLEGVTEKCRILYPV